MKNILILIAVASCLTAACHTASLRPASAGLLACEKLQDPGERVRCYDAQVAALQSARAAPSAHSAPAAMPAPSVALAGATPQHLDAQFGAESLPPSARPAEPRQESVLLSSISAMHELRRNVYEIVLANGQVWRQDGAAPAAYFFRVGDDVRIEKGLWGLYRLSTPRTGVNNWVRVTRIR